MKLFILIENSSAEHIRSDYLKYIVRKFTSVYRLKTKYQSQPIGEHHGTFFDRTTRCQGVGFSICPESHASSSRCRERNKMMHFENGNDVEVTVDEKIDQLLEFCRDISENQTKSDEKENSITKHRCTPFIRFCDLFSNFLSRTLIPDAENNKCCIIIGNWPKSSEEHSQYFTGSTKWTSTPSYRSMCNYLNSGVQHFLWIDTFHDDRVKSSFLDHFMSSCKGMQINIDHIVHPLIPFSTLLHNHLNPDQRQTQKQKSIRNRSLKNISVNEVTVCELSGIGKLPALTVNIVDLHVSGEVERAIPTSLHFRNLIFNGSVKFTSLQWGRGFLLKPTSNKCTLLKELSEMMVDKNVSMVLEDANKCNYLIQALHISSGRCLVMHLVLDDLIQQAAAQSDHRRHPLIASYPFSILESWRKVENVHELIDAVQKHRLMRLETLLSAVRHHDVSRLLESPCPPCNAPSQRICSPNPPGIMPRSEEELKTQVVKLYDDALHAGHTALRLASSVRHLVATVHRYSRYRNRRFADNKSWSVSFVDSCLKKDSEMIKAEHDRGSTPRDNALLLTEFQLQILIAFEVNALELTEAESEPNCQLVDWAADIMQTFVMLSPNRQCWREFLHVSLADAYHSVLGLTLLSLFEELGQDPPPCLPEEFESDRSFVEALGASFHEEEAELDREKTTTSPSSSIGRRDSLSRPDLGDQASQSSNVIHVTPRKMARAPFSRKRRYSGSRTRTRRKSGQSPGARSAKSPSRKKRRISKSKDRPARPTSLSPMKTPTKTSTLVVKGTPAHRSGQPRWERARKKAAEKSGGKIVIEESPQKPVGREFRRLRRNDSSSQGFEKGEAWKVAIEDHEISLSQFVEINGLDFDDGENENEEPSKDTVVLFQAGDSLSRDRHSNLFANFQESPKSSTVPFSPPHRSSSPVKTGRPFGQASPTKSILRTPVKGSAGNLLSPVKSSLDKRRVLMSPRVRRRTFSGNEPADAFLDEGTMFLDVNEFTKLSTTPDDVALLDSHDSRLRTWSDGWQSPKRRDRIMTTSSCGRNPTRVCRRLFATPEKTGNAVDLLVGSPVPQALRRRLVFSKDSKGNP